MPLLSSMLDRGQSKSAWTRAFQSALWLAVVLAPVIVAYHWWKSQEAPVAPRMTLESFLRQPETGATATVTLPAGTRIPLKVHIGGDIVQDNEDMSLPLILARPIDVVVIDGKLNGRFRVADGEWKQRAYSLWIEHVELDGALTPATGPVVSVNMTMTVKH
jgi:hypothetical protein